MRFSTPAIILSMLAPFAAHAADNLVYLCNDEDCNDCIDSWVKLPDNGDLCVDAYEGLYKSARIEPLQDISGAQRIISYVSTPGTTGECGGKDTGTGCKTVTVGSDGGCLGFLHPNGDWPEQMYFGFGDYCFPV